MRVIAAVALPPPVHGQSLVNKSIIDRLASGNDLKLNFVDIGPGQRHSRLAYHVTRLRRVASAMGAILASANSQPKTFYTVVESGWGIIYNFALLGAARLLGYRLFLHHHSAAHTLSERRSFRYLLRFTGPDLTHVVLDPTMGQHLGDRYPEANNIFVLPNTFVVHPPESTSVERMEGTLRVGFLSNLTNEKGLDVILEMAQRTVTAKLNISYRIGGPLASSETRLALQTACLDLGGCIDYIGPVYGDAKDAFFRSIDVFCFPSRYIYEAQPLVVIEAMSHGCAVIVSSQGYLPTLVQKAGVVLSGPRMADASLQQCQLWLRNPGDLQRHRAASRSQFEHDRTLAEAALIQFVSMLSDTGSRQVTAPLHDEVENFQGPETGLQTIKGNGEVLGPRSAAFRSLDPGLSTPAIWHRLSSCGDEEL